MMKENIDVDYSNSPLSFPQKLFALLEVDTTGVIVWAHHGLCFRITDNEKFSKEIVPKYFKRKIYLLNSTISKWMTELTCVPISC